MREKMMDKQDLLKQLTNIEWDDFKAKEIFRRIVMN